jgi:thioredoxin reductase (NADPH)
MSVYDVLIVGAGPAGLAAAIAAREHGLDYVVLEKGALVNSIFHFPTHMVFFTTPELLEIGGLPFVSPFEKPTRVEALRYYRRVVDSLQLRVELGITVCGVERREQDGLFLVHTKVDEAPAVRRARAVILAIGYYDHPNLLGVPGEDLSGVSHYYGEAHPFYRKEVVIVGGGNSAVEAALELYRAGAKVTLVHRNAAFNRSIKYWVLPDLENRIKEGSIAARMNRRVVEIRPGEIVVDHEGTLESLPADQVFLLTGYRTDAALLQRAGVEVDACTWIPAHNPETYETSVPNLFLAGGVIAGTNTVPIFIENGRFHGPKAVEVIAARLKGDAPGVRDQ